MAELTREQAAKRLAHYAEAYEDNARRYGDTDSGRGAVAPRMGADALLDADRLTASMQRRDALAAQAVQAAEARIAELEHEHRDLAGWRDRFEGDLRELLDAFCGPSGSCSYMDAAERKARATLRAWDASTGQSTAASGGRDG